MDFQKNAFESNKKDLKEQEMKNPEKFHQIYRYPDEALKSINT